MLMNTIFTPHDMYKDNLLPNKPRNRRMLHWVRSLKALQDLPATTAPLPLPAQAPKMIKMSATQIKFQPEDLDEENLQWQEKIAELTRYSASLREVYDRELAQVQSLWRKMKFSSNSQQDRHLFLKNLLAKSNENEHLSRSLEFQISEMLREIRKVGTQIDTLKKEESYSAAREAMEYRRELTAELGRVRGEFGERQAVRERQAKEAAEKAKESLAKAERDAKTFRSKGEKAQGRLKEAKLGVQALEGEAANKEFHLGKLTEENRQYESGLRKTAGELERVRALVTLGLALEEELGTVLG